MPKRRLTIHACLAGLWLTGSALVNADSSPWNGSYAANGQCFCAGSLGREIDSEIVPTPVGGQSVGQVCERVGDGPELQKVNGKFNFTVFPDRQCGHGPALDTKLDQQCIGHRGVSDEDCEAKGPEWDLVSAYAKSSSESETNPEPGIYDTVSATGVSRYILPPSKSASASSENTPVEEIAATRKSSTKMHKPARSVAKDSVARKPVPETREQLRERQLEHLAEARERARLREEAAQPEPNMVTKSVTRIETTIGAVPEAVTKPATDKPSIAAASDAAKNAVDTEKADSAKESIASVAKATSAKPKVPATPGVLSALQLPLSLGRGSKDFDFIEGAPVSFDFGGAGLRLTASKSSHNRVQYVLRAALADTYQEVSLGVGYFVSPHNMPRVTFMANGGLETGRFEFRDDELEAELSDTGAFLELASRFAVTSKFKVQGGFGYSSFFETDLLGFGEALFHLTNEIDLSTRVEAGDNDLIGFGIRYHY